jgi:undecaprenyl-diphosphatase
MIVPDSPSGRVPRGAKDVIMGAIYHMTYLQAVVIGLIQGVTELFPISSLGHIVLVPAWIGGTWGTMVRQESSPDSPYLAFVVGLHLATALVLLGFYIKTWVRVIRGLITSIVTRRVTSTDQRLAWLLVVATIPVGIAGLVLEHPFRVLFAKPLAAAIFLTINGGILFGAEVLRRRRAPAGGPAEVPRRGPVAQREPVAQRAPATQAAGAGAAGQTQPMPASAAEADETDFLDEAAEQRLAGLGLVSALWIGASQILALLAGISREGVTMAGGLVRGLSHEDAMRFSFLLSTPVILAAGALKISDLTGSLGNGVRGQILAGSAAAAISSLFAVVFLARYFRTRTLTPFAIYCVAAGLISIIRFGFF